MYRYPALVWNDIWVIRWQNCHLEWAICLPILDEVQRQNILNEESDSCRKSYQSVACRCVCYTSLDLQVHGQDHSHGLWSFHLANNVPPSLESLRRRSENTEVVKNILVKRVDWNSLAEVALCVWGTNRAPLRHVPLRTATLQIAGLSTRRTGQMRAALIWGDF